MEEEGVRAQENEPEPEQRRLGFGCRECLQTDDELKVVLILTCICAYILMPVAGLVLLLNIDVETLQVVYFGMYVMIQGCCLVFCMFSCLILSVEKADKIRKRRRANKYERDLAKWKMKQRRINKRNPDYPLCLVCCDNVQSTRLNCGHTIMCYLCAKMTTHQFGVCPICSVRIQEIEEDYASDGNDWSPRTGINSNLSI